MEMDQQLLNDLIVLREELKERASKKGNHFFISDAVLQQIAIYKPTKLSDFEGISGVGRAFIENYAESFLKVVKVYVENPENAVTLNKKGIAILQDFEKKLVNLNRKNHLLYCAKLYNKFGIDLYNATNDIRNIILGSGRAANITKTEDATYKPVISLLRNNARNLREKGQNNLFVAYPFVKGKFAGEDFTIRAPLALFPVKGERSASGIKLSLDKDREVLYNSTLILANFKFNGINKPLPDVSVEETSKENFISSLLAFYAENKIPITLPENYSDEDGIPEIIPFENYTSDTFPTFKKGEFYLENSAVLGLFAITSSQIQKDFQQIVESKKINKLLDDLLGNKDYEPFEGNNVKDVSEKDIVYINKLDAAQENVIASLSQTDELVVQGPPGTGKSQTITSLIANYAAKDKSILLVSEKKTALDVVYSRLGNLSKYALILDDTNDKLSFYSQMEVMAQLEETDCIQQDELSACEEEIDSCFAELKKIDDAFYRPDEFGIEPYKLYLLCNLQDILQKENLKKIRNYTSMLKDSFSAGEQIFKYEDAVAANVFFKDVENVSKVTEYLKLTKDFFWLAKTRKNLTDFELQDANIDFDKINEDRENRYKLNFFQKFFSKNIIKLDLQNFINKYFDFVKDSKGDKKLARKILKLFYKNQETFENGFAEYNNFWKLDCFYNEIPEIIRKYYSAMEVLLPALIEKENKTELTSEEKNQKLQITNDELCNYLASHHLIEIEAKYREQISSIDNFDLFLSKINADMAKKRQMEKQHLENRLADHISILSKSKRRSDIQKQIESKRKWSVNKFINKFNFELFNAVKIWLLTPEVVSEIIPLEAGFFDLVVFDEASQMFVEKGLPSILRGKQVVVAGDQMQLRPSNIFAGRYEADENAFDQDSVEEDEEIAMATDEESLLDLARFKYNNVLLNFHYRSKYEELIAFSNYAFYDGKLNVSPNRLKPELPPVQVHKMENALWTKRANEVEANYIVQLIKEIFKERKNNETIGVITFNTNQRDKIDDLLDRECENDPEFAKTYAAELERKEGGQDRGLFVKNIETVQGDERDIIIFSMGYAKNEEGKFIQNFGWLNQSGGENRLNVAVSRAKQQVHIVVSFDPSELKTDGAKNNGPETLKKYLEFAFAVSSDDVEKEKLLLESLISSDQKIKETVSDEECAENDVAAEKEKTAQLEFEAEIEHVLSDHGYDFDKNVGIGGYTIDYAIKNDGQYVLGIECDGRLYENSSSARERDYYRQKYLEARGWKTYRIWSILWKKNPEKAAEKLLKCLEDCCAQ